MAKNSRWLDWSAPFELFSGALVQADLDRLFAERSRRLEARFATATPEGAAVVTATAFPVTYGTQPRSGHRSMLR